MAEAQTVADAKVPYADVLSDNRKPSLSAHSDMPVIDLATPKPVDAAVEGGKEKDTSSSEPGAPPLVSSEQAPSEGGEADGQPHTEGAGEGKDTTSARDRAVITRFKNQAKAADERSRALEVNFGQKLAELTETLSKLVAPMEAKKDQRPTRESFDTPEAFYEALESWSAKRAEVATRAQFQEEQTKQQQESHRKAQLDAFNERRATFEADHPDFEDVVFSEDVKISAPMSQAILEAEDGPQIAYYLGQNPEVAERIAGLTPATAVYEIGKISAKLANPPKPRPEPIRPLAARNTSGPKTPDEESMDEYGTRRSSELRKKPN